MGKHDIMLTAATDMQSALILAGGHVKQVLVFFTVPDFIANCGMARVFAYLMETGAEITDHAIFADTSRVITAALARTHRQSNAPTGIAQRSFEMALRQLV